MFKFYEKADHQLQKDVENELKWDPSLTSTEVTVAAKDGVITLRGSVPHYAEKAKAEKAAQRVGGVRAVADEIEVSLMGSYERSDADIANAAITGLEWNYEVPEGIKITVDRAWITLRGEVEWDFQRNAANEAVRLLMGVRGVTNEISIKSKVTKFDVKKRIEDALKRSAESEGFNINVAVSGDCVTLTGTAHSFSEIEDARTAAWSAPGVMSVENNLRLAA